MFVEIDLYKKMENNLEWFDINQEDAKHQFNTDQLSRRLHVMKDGNYKGASAFNFMVKNTKIKFFIPNI